MPTSPNLSPPEVGRSWVTGGEPSLHLLAGRAWGLGAVSALSRGGPGPLHFPSGTWNHFMSVRTPTPDFHNCRGMWKSPRAQPTPSLLWACPSGQRDRRNGGQERPQRAPQRVILPATLKNALMGLFWDLLLMASEEKDSDGTHRYYLDGTR